MSYFELNVVTHVMTFYSASAGHRTSCRLSVRLSVSVTRWYCIKMTQSGLHWRISPWLNSSWKNSPQTSKY